mmetsp:Transcript_55831/g.148887  ORF Transcript_55831/g.148887 Transcript_55831/m.148887 type:complete len:269 (-) Transcript_55831:98-904(-)
MRHRYEGVARPFCRTGHSGYLPIWRQQAHLQNLCKVLAELMDTHTEGLRGGLCIERRTFPIYVRPTRPRVHKLTHHFIVHVVRAQQRISEPADETVCEFFSHCLSSTNGEHHDGTSLLQGPHVLPEFAPDGELSKVNFVRTDIHEVLQGVQLTSSGKRFIGPITLRTSFLDQRCPILDLSVRHSVTTRRLPQPLHWEEIVNDLKTPLSILEQTDAQDASSTLTSDKQVLRVLTKTFHGGQGTEDVRILEETRHENLPDIPEGSAGSFA